MRLAGILIAAVGVAGFAAYDQYDKRVNFKRVDARISAVNEQCYMEKVTREVITKTTSTSDLLRCELAQVLTREHPKWQGYTVKHKIEIRFAFISPVDGATHTSSLEMSSFPNGRPLRAGEVLPVLASKTKADKTRAI
ncbi:hypothetical protein [Bradyrhizobium sp. CB3481]|uniref:hypothetical protein n=1 Tax=Bradyrhizobium sp. CB3481 TaxID=3039158 RepID=UPI0024B03CAB|nr:hypothetical protein [Bradyrhizobium sp. CB3481]WFU20056.1 hypothetical protein QA643_17860 [Bradyrhizobium sp. CB3481]